MVMHLMLIMNLIQCTHNFEKWDVKGREVLFLKYYLTPMTSNIVVVYLSPFTYLN
jgi:hypothetical protein